MVTERKSVAGPFVGVLWMLSFSGSCFSGVAFLGSVFPDAVWVIFGVCLAAFASSTVLGLGIVLFAGSETIDRM